jgi:branched-chain amino acid transport system substrate-binding protein
MARALSNHVKEDPMRAIVRLLPQRSKPRATRLATVAAAGITVLIVTAFTTHKQAAAPYKVALVGPQTGVFAPSTVGFLNSAQQKFDAINKKGGINGHQIELIVKDDGGQPNQTLQAVRDLQDQGVKVFIGVYTAGVLALQPLMNGSLILFTANPPAIQNDPKQLPYDFNFFPPNKYAVLKDAKYAKKLGLTKLAIVSDTTAQFQEYVDLAKTIMPTYGQQIVLEQRYDPATTDFSPVIAKIKDSGADGVLFFAAGSPVTRLMTAAAAANLQLPILGGYGNAAADLTSVPSAYLQKYAYFISTTPGLLKPDGTPLISKYGAIIRQIFYHHYGFKSGIGGGVTWDLASAIVWSLQKAGSDDPNKMRAALESTARASAGIAFTSSPVIYHFSKDTHGGFPPSQVAVARSYGSAAWPGFYYSAG